MTDDMIEEIKELLPEIDFNNLDSMSGIVNDMTMKIEAMEKREEALLKTVKQMSNMFVANAAKLQEYEERQEVTAKKQMELAQAIVQANMQFLKIDYEAFLVAITARYPDWDITLGNEMFTVANETLGMPALIEKVAKKVSIDKREEIVKEALGDLDTDNIAEEVAENIDMSEVAENIWSNYFDPCDHWDSYELADHFDISEIAGYIDAEYVADYVSKSEIAEHIQYNDAMYGQIAKHVSLKAIVQRLDLDIITNKVVESLRDPLCKIIEEKLLKKEEEE